MHEVYKMYTSILYTLDVGGYELNKFKQGFTLAKDVPDFGEPILRIPLVHNTLIGRAESHEEQELCKGDILGEIDQPDLGGGVTFGERTSYNGRKVIIPDGMSADIGVSRKHGELRLDEQIRFYYMHLSESGAGTYLWIPEKGFVAEAHERGEVINLDFQRGEPQASRYLLLGGHKDSPTLEDRIPWSSYYILIRRTEPDIKNEIRI